MSARQLDARTLRSLIAGVCMAIRPRFPGGIVPWAKAQKVPITSTQNCTYAGEKYDLERFPVMASLMCGFFEHPTARELFLEKSVQSTATTIATFCCGWQLTEGEPGNIIYVMHNRNEARLKLESDIDPILRNIPGLRGRRGENAADPTSASDESRAEVLIFPGGSLSICGGQTASGLTGKHARTVLLDEAERHGMMGKDTSFGLARGRLFGADNGKLVAFSKPEKQSEWSMDAATGQWKVKKELRTLMDAEWVGGDQREFHCPCPCCGTWNSIQWENIHYRHLNEALPGMKQPIYNPARFEKEVYWECPGAHPDGRPCRHRVHEGPEKHAMILAGARPAMLREPGALERCWPPCPLEKRREKGAKPYPEPHKWSARVSALTDIAFSVLKWGALAQQWVNAQGDSSKIVNFVNEILGKPESPMAAEDTTIEHLRKLIPKAPPRPNSTDPLPWKYRHDDGTPTYVIPLLAAQLGGQFEETTSTWGPVKDESRRARLCIGMTVDRQTGKQDESGFLPYLVRAYHYDGRSFLIDQGRFPYHEQGNWEALVDYMRNTTFRTLDDVSFGIDLVWMDLGGEDVPDAYDFCYDYGDGHEPRVEGCRGIGYDGTGQMPRESDGENIWAGQRKNSLDKPVMYWKTNAQYWEKYLYETTIQRFTPARHRPWAPAIYFPLDIEEDYLRGLCAMHVVDVPIRKTDPRSPTRPMYVKKSSAHVNDPGDLEKIARQQAHWYRLRHLKRGLQVEEPLEPEEGEGTVKDSLTVAPAEADTERKVRDYLLKSTNQ